MMLDVIDAGMPVLDVVVAALLGAVLWRLGRQPATWAAHEARLRATVDALRSLVGEAETQARALDGRLATHARELRALVASARPVRANARGDAADAGVARRVRELAARGTAVEEIARRLEVPPAEVRLLVGLQAAGAGPAPAAGKKRAAESAA